MKKLILGVMLLLCISSFGQSKIKQPTFKITYDKFENQYQYDGNVGNISIYAVGNNNDFTGITYQALYFTIYDSYLTYAKDVILLFSDGSKMKINTEEELGERVGNLWKYYIVAYPTQIQWEELTNKNIIGYKVHIFERTYKTGEKFKTLVNNFYE